VLPLVQQPESHVVAQRPFGDRPGVELDEQVIDRGDPDRELPRPRAPILGCAPCCSDPTHPRGR
jgi:hypothetical protein